MAGKPPERPVLSGAEGPTTLLTTEERAAVAAAVLGAGPAAPEILSRLAAPSGERCADEARRLLALPREERVQALIEAIEATEAHLRGLGFDPATLLGAKGFARIKGLANAVEAVYSSDEAKRRFEIMAREVFNRFKALLVEPSAWAYAERHDNIEAIYKKLTERRDTADVTELLKASDLIVFTTVASAPHIADAWLFDHNPVVLHVSLRDLAPEILLRSQNVVDDVEHVMKANTSPHLTEQQTGNRTFVTGTLAEIMRGHRSVNRSRPIVFSPFGMGILDVAVGKWVYDQAVAAGQDLRLSDFFYEVVR